MLCRRAGLISRLIRTPGVGKFGGPKCTQETDAVVQRLEKSPVLELLPPGAKGGEINKKRPCDDEDNLGEVSRRITATQKNDELLAHFREEFPRNGWVLKHERAKQGREPGGLDIGEPDQCYENPVEPNVTLEVLLRPAYFYLAFRLTGGTYSCANTTSPPQTR